MPELPPTTSASQLTAYAMCPRLFRYRYVDHAEPEFRSLNLALGSTVHSAIGWWFEERLAAREPTLEQLDTIVAADLMAETCLGNIRWKAETPDSLEQKAKALVRTYLTGYGDLPVVRVEERFEVDIADLDSGECLPRPLVGYFDLVVREGDEVVEIKTTSSAWSKFSLERHLQVGAYVTAANVLHGGPSRVAVHTIIKQKTPRVEVHTVERGESDNRWFFEAAEAIEGAIFAGHFPPSPGPTCFECEFGARCLGRKASVVAVRSSLHREPPPLAIAV